MPDPLTVSRLPQRGQLHLELVPSPQQRVIHFDANYPSTAGVAIGGQISGYGCHNRSGPKI